MKIGDSNDIVFISRLTKIVEANLADEKFGVNELAAKTGLSRSQIHRRLKKDTNKSLSQFIREIRLEKAKELLKSGHLTVSEIAYKVGFGSPSYFIKSFHDYYGYPPGDIKKQNGNKLKTEKENQFQSTQHAIFKHRRKIIMVLSAVVIFLFSYFIYSILPFEPLKKKKDNSVEKLIIVLPLKSLSNEKNDSIFAEGIFMDIRNQLTKITGLKVLPRSTSEQFQKDNFTLEEISKQADEVYILEGIVRREHKDIRINVELIDGLKNLTLWSHNYDRPMADIFVIQSDIAKNVATQLKTILSSEEIKQIEKLQPVNAVAYNNYLMGRYLWDRRDSISLQKSVEYFERAIEIDSGYVLAYAGLADAYYAQSFRGFVNWDTGYNKAFKMATQANKMDKNLPEPYAVLGIVNYFGFWEWENANDLFEQALAIDSNCMVAHLYYCSYLDIVGKTDNALKHANRAIELEPYFHMPYLMKGIIYRNQKKIEKSTEAFIKSNELEPLSWESNIGIFLNYLDLNDNTRAIQTILQYFSSDPKYQKYKDEILLVFKRSGINEVIKLYINIIIEKKEPGRHILLPALYLRLGMKEEALDNLEKACRSREWDIPRIIRKPEFENLHSNPRFQALVDTMNLRPYFPKPSI